MIIKNADYDASCGRIYGPYPFRPDSLCLTPGMIYTHAPKEQVLVCEIDFDGGLRYKLTDKDKTFEQWIEVVL
jgi:hypothetical protein